ncbi:hypothetical protein ABK040_007787 [Willaertia magna]
MSLQAELSSVLNNSNVSTSELLGIIKLLVSKVEALESEVSLLKNSQKPSTKTSSSESKLTDKSSEKKKEKSKKETQKKKEKTKKAEKKKEKESEKKENTTEKIEVRCIKEKTNDEKEVSIIKKDDLKYLESMAIEDLESPEKTETFEFHMDCIDVDLLSNSNEKLCKYNVTHGLIAEDEILISDDENIENKEVVLDFSQGADNDLSSLEEQETANNLLQELSKEIEIPAYIFDHFYPHQKRGLKFLWDNISQGNGCILADFMGLGKTLQCATFLYLYLLHKALGKTALVVSPASVNTHWIREFEKLEGWSGEASSIKSVQLNSKTPAKERMKIVQNWHTTGGVLVTSYDLFRTLCLDKEYYTYFLNPGPEIIVLDEGHKIRHLSSRITKVVNAVNTLNRIILTGYPFQNNMYEYWTMINFVRPNFLGEKGEFKKMYVTPIQKGVSSTGLSERRVARRRAWLLYEKVKPVILRRDVSVLKKFLPKKQEIVLTLSNSDIQKQMYKELIGSLKELDSKPNIFWAYDVIIMLCNHPDVLHNYYIWKGKQIETHIQQSEKKSKEKKKNSSKETRNEYYKKMFSVEEETNSGELFEPVIDDEEIAGYIKKIPDAKELLEEEDTKLELEKQALSILATVFEKSDTLGYKKAIVDNGGKMLLLFSVIFQCKKVGDRLVVFSRSINTLDFIESTLKRYNKNKDKNNQVNFLRFDGSTPTDARQNCIDQMNNLSSDLNVLLISTLAGCEGINLIGANRVALVDVNWNPSHDSEAVCRVFRIGQTKPVYIYRMICENTMEDLVLKRQLMKENLSNWIVDDGNFSVDDYDTNNLYILPEDDEKLTDKLLETDTEHHEKIFIDNQIEDDLIMETIKKYSKWVIRADKRDQLLREDPLNILSEEEKLLAHREKEFDDVYAPKRNPTTRKKKQTSKDSKLQVKTNLSGLYKHHLQQASVDSEYLQKQMAMVEKEKREENRILELLHNNHVKEGNYIQNSTTYLQASLPNEPVSAGSSSSSRSGSSSNGNESLEISNNVGDAPNNADISSALPICAYQTASHSLFEKEKNKMMKQLCTKSTPHPIVPNVNLHSNKPKDVHHHKETPVDPYEIDLEMENTKKRKMTNYCKQKNYNNDNRRNYESNYKKKKTYPNNRYK